MFESKVYLARREQLKNKINTGIILITGNSDSSMSYPSNTYNFRQDSTFLYLFGLNIQNLVGVIDVDNNKEYIFGNDVDIEDIIWMGKQIPLSEKAKEVGVENTDIFDNVFGFVKKAQQKGQKIHFLPPYRQDHKILLSEIIGLNYSEIKDNSSVELIKALVSLREIKDEYEFQELLKAAKIGYEMHTTAMKMAREGVLEQKIAGTIEGIALSKGWGISFPVILSQNGETLHNHNHNKLLKKGRLMLTDAGAETNMNYCSDNTRVTPIGGFTQKQLEIYEIVRKATNESIKMCKPDIYYKDVHLNAAKIITQGLKDLGLMKGNVDDAIKNGAHAMFFPHGLGHMMGLDVHDMENYGENYVGYDETISRVDQFGTAYLRLAKQLKKGFVLTVEPGIYFIPDLIEKWKKEKINNDYINFNKVEKYLNFGGIRLEDDIIVTENACEIIGKRIPISPKKIEELL